MTFTKVSVLVPTRHRIERLRTMISSFDATTGNLPNAELVFRVDDDDIATRDFLLAWGGHKVIVGPRMQGYDSMPSFYNELAAAASGDVLMCGNDDMVFRTLGWPALVLAEAGKHPDGLFNVGVSTHNEDHYPFSIVSRRVVEVLGFLWDPRIFWGDIFLRDVMGMLGRTVKLPGVQVDHDWAGFNPDALFRESDKDIVSRDPTYWAQGGTHRTAVEDALVKLRPLAKVLHLCVPTLKRYDLLKELLESLRESTVHPTVHVVDNGRNPAAIADAASIYGGQVQVFTPDVRLGLAEAWNWFIRNVPEERLICNDDVTFAPGSLAMLMNAQGDFVSALPGTNAFSCFLLRDSCVEKVGLFDEHISPGYAYYEDCDYVERMIRTGIPIVGVPCGVEHVGSQTTAVNTPGEWMEHHEKFMIAQGNFVKKWGRMPNEAAAKAVYEASLR